MRMALVLIPSWPRDTPSLSIAYLADQFEKENHEIYIFEFNFSFSPSLTVKN